MPKTELKRSAEKSTKKRAQVSQQDVPSYSIEQALRIPKAIAENYGSKPSTPLQVAKALNVQPNSSQFRMIAGASIAYGLTKGGPFAKEISIEDLGKRIVKPLSEGDDLVATREAFLKPRVINEFMQKYHASPLPRIDIALNVLENMGVPKSRAKAVYELILNGAESVGFIQEIKNKKYIELSSTKNAKESSIMFEDSDEEISEADDDSGNGSEKSTVLVQIPISKSSAVLRRVFIAHGKNKKFIEPVKELLSYGELEPVISTERPSVSQPVPSKVNNEMRKCGAAIIHVDAETKIIDKDGNEHIFLNPNVLIEIGASMALYGDRFILLVKEGVNLPSNLQGLFKVHYKGDSLDGSATIQLLKAIKDIKNHPLPERFDQAKG